MSTHRIIWYIAGSAVLLAAIVLTARKAGDRSEGVGPGDAASQGSQDAQMSVNTMMDLLSKNAAADKPQRRAAVEAVAKLVEQGQLDSAEGYYALGLFQARQRSFGAAEKAFRKAIALRPDWSWPHNSLGILLGNHAVGRDQEAESELRTAIRLDPEWSRPHNDLAVLLRIAGRLDQAETEATTALRLDPNNVATHNNYGNLLVACQRLSEAEPHYRKAIELDPEHPKPHYNLACL